MFKQTVHFQAQARNRLVAHRIHAPDHDIVDDLFRYRNFLVDFVGKMMYLSNVEWYERYVVWLLIDAIVYMTKIK